MSSGLVAVKESERRKVHHNRQSHDEECWYHLRFRAVDFRVFPTQ